MKRKRKISRREFVAVVGTVGALAGHEAGQAHAAETGPIGLPDVYATLGIKPFINAAGTITTLGASLMPPEVVAAWTAAAQQFVDLDELADKVGQRIAKLLDVEGAMVTTGAAGALLVAVAGVLTKSDATRIKQLPDTTGLANEVILQKSHHSCYDSQLLAAGGRLIEVESLAELEKAAGAKSALMFYMNVADGDGRIKRAEWLAFAKKRGIPTLLDAAADVPPASRLTEYVNMGFDLVAFSGGKAIRGPNDTGLLLGRKDLIDAARANASPRCPSVGRGLKVSKEDLVACWAAIERFVKLDPQEELRIWEKRLDAIEAVLRGVPTLTTERITPPIANNVPHLIVDWDVAKLGKTPAEVTKLLAQGEPAIRLARVHHTGTKGICVSVLVLQDGEAELVGKRLREVLSMR
jgi:L-seryl-tRNA(Ser) seleniumtransferase